jgi:Flp pilus assembly protein TadG
MRAFTWARNFLRSERGNVMVMAAATMPLMVGAAAVGLDTIQLSIWKRQLQRMADSAALAGTRALNQSRSHTDAVTRDLQLNNQLTLLSAAVVQNGPATGPFAGNNRAVRVVLSAKRTLPFWQMFQGDSPTVTVEATGMIVSTGPFCLLTLEEGPVTAIDFGGNANVNLGCGVATNATGNPAIDAGGSASFTANPIIAMGGLNTSNSLFGNSTLIPYADKQQDPFANRTDPSTIVAPMNCSAAFVPGSGPGCYSSMNINQTLNLPAGTYYIKNGDANFGSSAKVTGNNVTLVFTGDGDQIGKFDMDGQAELTLKAPNNGPYADIVLFRDRDRLTTDELKINGGNTLDLVGAIYMPKTHLWINGNSTLASNCLQIVSQRITFRGSMDLQNNCTGGRNAPTLTYVRLVG